jgi:hypothetical protein
MERLQSLAEVKNAADRALADLKLGEAAKTALKKAELLESGRRRRACEGGADESRS